VMVGEVEGDIHGLPCARRGDKSQVKAGTKKPP
jgi:hypothetical protein